MPSRDGNGWVRCDLGHRHWGLYGAAGMLVYVTGGPVLIQQRVSWSHHGGTWGLPGGARDSHESAISAALREAAEECGVPEDAVTQRAMFTDDHGGWTYTTVLAEAADAFPVTLDDGEAEEVEWLPPAEVSHLDLHPSFAAHWRRLQVELSPVTLIVDAANVVGSRPDGWWRDRAGAARRLRDELARFAAAGLTSLPEGVAGTVPPEPEPGAMTPPPPRPAAAAVRSWNPYAGSWRRREDSETGMADGEISLRWFPDVVMVVEGEARPAAAQPADGQVRLVAAEGEGDDTIAALAAQVRGRRVVVTADRELRQRCEAAGAAVAGPGWLLGLLRSGDDAGQ